MDFYKALNDKSKKEITIKVTRDGDDVTITLPRSRGGERWKGPR